MRTPEHLARLEYAISDVGLSAPYANLARKLDALLENHSVFWSTGEDPNIHWLTKTRTHMVTLNVFPS